MARFVVRYGVMRMVGVFSARAEMLRRGTQVIARTTRGLETGEVLCEATEQALAQLVDPPSGQIMREMTAEDINEATHLKTREREEFEICQKHVAALKLNMQLVDVEHLFGGERIVVYYLSEERVDFRELVKALANELQTRIEMRQIGVRDEAKLLADYGDCGKPVCCNTHLVEMPPVSMKMAKLQKATLDPTKISGRCGRLKCCLRYEYDTYEDLLKTLPPIGADVVTTTGRARILNHEILSQQLLVQTEDNRRLLIPATDVLSVLSTAANRSRNERVDRERVDRDQGDRDNNDRELAEPERNEQERGERGDRDRGGRGDRREPRGGGPGGRQGGGQDRPRGDQSGRQPRGQRPAQGGNDRRDRSGRRDSEPQSSSPGQPLDFLSAESTREGAEASASIKADEPQSLEPKQELRVVEESRGSDAPPSAPASLESPVANPTTTSENGEGETGEGERRPSPANPVDDSTDSTDRDDRVN
jgi:cell fate regulator YaaT (PSP1 superfamily)